MQMYVGSRDTWGRNYGSDNEGTKKDWTTPLAIGTSVIAATAIDNYHRGKLQKELIDAISKQDKKKIKRVTKLLKEYQNIKAMAAKQADEYLAAKDAAKKEKDAAKKAEFRTMSQREAAAQQEQINKQFDSQLEQLDMQLNRRGIDPLSSEAQMIRDNINKHRLDALKQTEVDVANREAQYKRERLQRRAIKSGISAQDYEQAYRKFGGDQDMLYGNIISGAMGPSTVIPQAENPQVASSAVASMIGAGMFDKNNQNNQNNQRPISINYPPPNIDYSWLKTNPYFDNARQQLDEEQESRYTDPRLVRIKKRDMSRISRETPKGFIY